MIERLVTLGAPRERIHYRPVGVDCTIFQGASPEKSARFLSPPGRFVEKKGPHLTASGVCAGTPAASRREAADDWRRRSAVDVS